MPRSVYAIAGLLVGAGVDLLVNLLAAAIQQRAFADRFDGPAVAWLAGLGIAGLLAGYWLGGRVEVPVPTGKEPTPPAGPGHRTTTITRLRALLSYARLRGQGVHLSDVLLLGSRLDVETED